MFGIVFAIVADGRCSASPSSAIMWGPMRARKAGLLQLLLMSIGLAFLLRYSDPVHLGHRDPQPWT